MECASRINCVCLWWGYANWCSSCYHNLDGVPYFRSHTPSVPNINEPDRDLMWTLSNVLMICLWTSVYVTLREGWDTETVDRYTCEFFVLLWLRCGLIQAFYLLRGRVLGTNNRIVTLRDQACDRRVVDEFGAIVYLVSGEWLKRDLHLQEKPSIASLEP